MARVGFLVGEMFEDSELRIPLDRLSEAGHEILLIGEEAGLEVTGKNGVESVIIDVAVEDVDASQLDALVIPGGYSPDHLRENEVVVDLISDVYDLGRPLAAVCHGPSLFIDADILEGRTVTSWPSIKNDLINAGADWVDEEVVQDGTLITSRNPGDLSVFCDAILQALGDADVTDEDEPVADADDDESPELVDHVR